MISGGRFHLRQDGWMSGRMGFIIIYVELWYSSWDIWKGGNGVKVVSLEHPVKVSSFEMVGNRKYRKDIGRRSCVEMGYMIVSWGC